MNLEEANRVLALQIAGASYEVALSPRLVELLGKEWKVKQVRTPRRRLPMEVLLGEAKEIYFEMQKMERSIDQAWEEGWPGSTAEEQFASRKKAEAKLAELEALWYRVPCHVKRKLRQYLAMRFRRNKALYRNAERACDLFAASLPNEVELPSTWQYRGFGFAGCAE
jgi:hypothetical protein